MDLLYLSYSQIRATWVPATTSCLAFNIVSMKPAVISTFTTDIILLLVMLSGLFRLNFHESGVFGLGHLMWNQVGVSVLLTSRGVSYSIIRLRSQGSNLALPCHHHLYPTGGTWS